MKHGQGIYKWPLGERYEGNFNKNKLCGHGKLFNPDGKLKYEGDFENNLVHGKGVRNFIESKNRYEGHFVNGKREGFGKFFYPSGA